MEETEQSAESWDHPHNVPLQPPYNSYSDQIYITNKYVIAHKASYNGPTPSCIYDTHTGKQLPTTNTIFSSAIIESIDEDTLAIGHSSEQGALVELYTLPEIKKKELLFQQPDAKSITAMTLLPHSTSLITGGEGTQSDGTLLLDNMGVYHMNDKTYLKFNRPNRALYWWLIPVDSNHFITSDLEYPNPHYVISLWNTAQKNPLYTIETPYTLLSSRPIILQLNILKRMSTWHVLHNNKYLVYAAALLNNADTNRGLFVHDFASGKLLHAIEGDKQSGAISSVQLVDAQTAAVTNVTDPVVSFYDLAKGIKLRQIACDSGIPNNVTQISKKILLAAIGKQIQVWNIEESKLENSFVGKEDNHYIFPLDETHIISQTNKYIQLWNINTGSCLFTQKIVPYDPLRTDLRTLLMSPDKTTVAYMTNQDGKLSSQLLTKNKA